MNSVAFQGAAWSNHVTSLTLLNAMSCCQCLETLLAPARLEGKEDLDTLTTFKLLNKLVKEFSWRPTGMKELESTQLNSLALQIMVAISKISIGDGVWPGSIPKLYFSTVWKSISRLAPKPCRDQFSSMDGFRPMPCWSCLVYLVSKGNLSNSARSQQEMPQ